MDGGEAKHSEKSSGLSVGFDGRWARAMDSFSPSRATQILKGCEHMPVGIVGVPAAWIREQVYRHTGKSSSLKTKQQPGGCLCFRWEDHAKDGQAEQGDDLWPKSGHFSPQSDDARPIFMRSEDIDARTGAANDIREAQPPCR
jgi:hypothetical protein